MNNAISGFMGIDYGTLPSLFASGRVAMIADGTWDATTIQTANPEMKFGYFPIPGSNDPAKNKNLAGKYDMTWMVLEKSPNKEYAIKWLEMLSEKQNYTDFVNVAGFLPTQPDVKIKVILLLKFSRHLKTSSSLGISCLSTVRMLGNTLRMPVHMQNSWLLLVR